MMNTNATTTTANNWDREELPSSDTNSWSIVPSRQKQQHHEKKGKEVKGRRGNNNSNHRPNRQKHHHQQQQQQDSSKIYCHNNHRNHQQQRQRKRQQQLQPLHVTKILSSSETNAGKAGLTKDSLNPLQRGHQNHNQQHQHQSYHLPKQKQQKRHHQPNQGPEKKNTGTKSDFRSNNNRNDSRHHQQQNTNRNEQSTRQNEFKLEEFPPLAALGWVMSKSPQSQPTPLSSVTTEAVAVAKSFSAQMKIDQEKGSTPPKVSAIASAQTSNKQQRLNDNNHHKNPKINLKPSGISNLMTTQTNNASASAGTANNKKKNTILEKKKKKVLNFDINPKKNNNNGNSNFQLSIGDDAFATFHKDNMLPLGTTVKGKQKLRARKKRLTPLKKQVLKERLLQWENKQREKKEADRSRSNMNDGKSLNDKSPIVYLHGFIEQGEEIEDDDEHDEIVSDLQDMAEKVGVIDSLFIPRKAEYGLAFVRFSSEQDADRAKNCWDGMVIGGNKVKVGIISKQDLQSNGGSEDYEVCLDKWIDVVKTKKISDFDTHDLLDSCSSGKVDSFTSPVVVLGNILTEDDLEDEECMDESLDDIKTLATQYGDLTGDGVQVDYTSQTVHITYKAGSDVAFTAADKLDGTVLGGQIMSAKVVDRTMVSGLVGNVFNDNTPVVYLHGYIEQGEEFDDDDEYEEVVSDLIDLAEKVGPIQSSFIPRDAKHGLCFVHFRAEEDAQAAKKCWDGIIIGGNKVKVGIISKKALQSSGESYQICLDKWLNIVQKILESKDISEIEAISDNDETKSTSIIVILGNILTEDDFEDEGCMDESLEDIRMLASQYGPLTEDKLYVDNQSQTVHIKYKGNATSALSAASQLDGLVIGGQTITARISNGGQDAAQPIASSKDSIPNANKLGDPEPGPMYSGDKIIPEQYAECKRVPKIPNSGKPRSYASLLGDDDAIPLLYEMLGELMRLQLRSKDDKNANARRRLVMGLREVARGIRANKIKMIICANNLDQYGVIDEKIQGIIDSAGEKDIPIIYELNKRKIGKAIGKTIKVSIVGIQNADGAQMQFKRLKKMHHLAS